MRSPSNTAVEFRGITKSFGSNLASNDVSFSIQENTVHGVVGENGAGKSTIMKILYGLYPPDAGSLWVNGQEVSISSPLKAISLGIGMVHQHFKLVPSLTVWENIILGQEPSKFLSKTKALAALSEIQNQYGFNLDLEAVAEDLPVGLQQQLEILKLLYRQAKILILDEPTAVLTPQEVDKLFEKLLQLKERGRTIILITHKLREILEFTTAVTVMRQGKVVESRPTAGLTENGLAEMIVGRQILKLPARKRVEPRTPLLQIKSLSLTKAKRELLKEINLTVHTGEILGIAGISGNGQQELAEVLSGVETAYSGQVSLFNGDLKQSTAYELKQKIGVIPPDRLREGLVPEFSVQENLVLGHQREKEFRRGPFFSLTKMSQTFPPLIERYDVRPRNLDLPVGALSGGNQQKVIFARETRTKARFIMAAYPTRGVDIGAIEFINKLFLEARDSGAAIVLISAELDEILAISDRIAVLYHGKIVGECDRAEATERKLGLWMTGAA